MTEQDLIIERRWFDTFVKKEPPLGGNIGDEFSEYRKLAENEQLEERFDLDEMSRVCKKADGYGIIIDIYSRDHGSIDNPRQPAHAHLFDTNMRSQGEFVLTSEMPKKPSDVIWYRTNNPPAGFAEKIVRWARGARKGVNNWAHTLLTWEDNHP